MEVITIAPHQYRQKDRQVGEIYEADDVNVSLLETLKFVKPAPIKTEAEPVETTSAKTKDRRRDLRTK